MLILGILESLGPTEPEPEPEPEPVETVFAEEHVVVVEESVCAEELSAEERVCAEEHVEEVEAMAQ